MRDQEIMEQFEKELLDLIEKQSEAILKLILDLEVE